MENQPDSVDFNISMGWSDDAFRRFELEFGSEANGDAIVVLHPCDSAVEAGCTAVQGDGPRYTHEGGGSGYHLYELIFDPDANSADLFVDGIEVLSDYAGFTSNTSAFIGWGDRTGTATTGNGSYNLVEFSIIPEPQTAMLFLAGLAGLAKYRRNDVGSRKKTAPVRHRR